MTATSRRCQVRAFEVALALALAHSAGYGQTTVVAGSTPGTFQVNESGAATYTIPIQVPPGIAGMEPKLSLAYNSQGGNGQLGLGWHLTGFSSIDRCGRSIIQDGAGAGVTYAATDKYCLDGQRLVLVSSGVNYGASGAVYATDRESYTKVVSFGFAGTGPMYFTAWTKSGQIIEYGNSPDSRIDAQGRVDGSARTYQVNKISDTKGNSITFEYNEDLPNGEFYPSAIKYAYNGTAFNAKVEFTYEDNRPDTISAYLGGSLIKTTKRLTSITTWAGAGATVPVRVYKLAYESPGGSSRVTSIQECNGAGATCLPQHSFAWQNGTAPSSGLAAPVNWGAAYYPSTQPLLADVDGDGFADLVYATGVWASPSIVVHFSNGNGFGGPVIVGSADTYDPGDGSTAFFPIALADVNGDGRADVVTVSLNYFAPGGNVRLSAGRSLNAPVNWGAAYYPSTQPLLADVDGDGFADLVYATGVWASPGSVVVHFSNGNGFGGPVIVGSADTYDPGDGSTAFFPIALADVNGDARADVVTVSLNYFTPGGNVRVAQSGTPDFLKVFTDSLGAQTTVFPLPLTDTSLTPPLYTVDTPAAAWPVRDRLKQGPMYVISKTSSSNGIGGNSETTYRYFGAKAHLKGGGFLGFRRVEEKKASGITVATEFRQDYPYQGLTARIEKTQPGGSLLSRVINTWADTANPQANPDNTGGYHRSILGQTIEDGVDLDGTLLPPVRTTYSNPDAYGNIQDILVETLVPGTYASEGYTKATHNDYKNDTSNGNWFLGRLTRSAVTSTIPTSALP